MSTAPAPPTHLRTFTRAEVAAAAAAFVAASSDPAAAAATTVAAALVVIGRSVFDLGAFLAPPRPGAGADAGPAAAASSDDATAASAAAAAAGPEPARRHPGGEAILRRFLGRDASEAFALIGHGAAAQRDALLLRVGRLADGE